MWDTSRQHEHLQEGFVTSNSSLTLDIIVLYWNYLGNTDTSQVRQVVEQYLLAKISQNKLTFDLIFFLN